MDCYDNNKYNEKRNTVNEFSIYHIFRLLIKNFLVIFLAAVVFAVGTFCYCKFYLQERYAASGSVVVTNGGILEGGYESNTATQQYPDDGKVNNSDITASINLIDTIVDTLATKDIYEELAQNLGNEYTAAQLRSFVTISKRDNYSLFIDVKFEMSNPTEVVKITNMYLNLTPKYISEYIPGAKTRVTESDGYAPKTYPQTFSSTILAAIVGALLAFVVVYIISLFNTTIESEEEFKERYNITVLGDIPDFSAAKSGRYTKSYYKGGKYYGN